MRLIVQDRRAIVRDAAPLLFQSCDFDVTCTVASDDELRHACARGTPDAALLEIDVTEWDVAQLINDLRRRHRALRLVGIGDADVAADTCLPRSAPLTTVVAALRGTAGWSHHNHDRRAGPSLTARQVQVLRLISQGNSAEEIAACLRVSTSTVAHHKREIFARLGARSQAQAVRTALRHRMLDAAGW